MWSGTTGSGMNCRFGQRRRGAPDPIRRVAGGSRSAISANGKTARSAILQAKPLNKRHFLTIWFWPEYSNEPNGSLPIPKNIGGIGGGRHDNALLVWLQRDLARFCRRRDRRPCPAYRGARPPFFRQSDPHDQAGTGQEQPAAAASPLIPVRNPEKWVGGINPAAQPSFSAALLARSERL